MNNRSLTFVSICLSISIIINSCHLMSHANEIHKLEKRIDKIENIKIEKQEKVEEKKNG